MILPTAQQIFATLEGTWPAAARDKVGPWTIRTGNGGGSRVSAATALGPTNAADIAMAEAAMQARGQRPLFMIRDGETALDALLDSAGYSILDPVTAYAAPTALIATQRPPPVTTFEVWPPLAVQSEIWAAGGIGPARLAIMHRVQGPHTALLGRLGDRPSGTAFVGCDGDIAMLHALEVLDAQRRCGLGLHLLRAAAFWAQDQRATWFSLVVTQANQGANRLYQSLGMQVVGHYHYRIHPGPAPS